MIGTINELSREVAEVGGQLREGAGAQAQLRKQLVGAQQEGTSRREQAALLEQVVALLQAIQESWSQRFQQSVGQLISEGLSGVFDEPLELLVEMGVSGDLPTVEFQVRDGRELVTDVMNARGGGLVNVAAFLLKVLMLLAARPAQARLLVLDESFVNVAEGKLGNVTALLRRICEEGGFQIVLVSHRPGLEEAADVVYEFSQQDGVTSARQVKGPGDEVAQAGVS